jgi:phasin family protein
MTFNTKDFAALGQAQFEKNTRLATILLNGAERIAALQLETAVKQLASQAEVFKSLTQVKDQKDLVAFQNSLTQPTIDQAYSAARNVYESVAATQKELTTFVEEQFAGSNQSFISSLDSLTKFAPAGSESAVNAFKTLVNQSNAVFENAAKTAKKVGADFTEASVQAATQVAQAATAAVAKK